MWLLIENFVGFGNSLYVFFKLFYFVKHENCKKRQQNIMAAVEKLAIASNKEREREAGD